MRNTSLQRRLWVACAFLLAINLCACADDPPRNPLAGTPQAPSGGGHAIRLDRVTVRDTVLNCDAGTMYIPQGWKLEGGMQWCGAMGRPTSLGIRIFNPDGLEQLTVYPRGHYVDGFRDYFVQQNLQFPQRRQAFEIAYAEGNHTGVQVNMPSWGEEIRRAPANAGDYLKQFTVPMYRPELAKAKIISAEDQMELAAKLLATIPNAAGSETKLTVTKLRLEYQVNEKTVQEDFCCTLVCRRDTNLPMVNAITKEPYPPVFMWDAVVVSWRAEKGQLDQLSGLMRALQQSFRPDVKWFNAMVQIDRARTNTWVALNGKRIEADVRMAQATYYQSQVREQITDEIRKMHDEREASQDKTNRMWDERFRDVEGWRDPQGGGVLEVPLEYGYVYKNDQGQVIVSTDPVPDATIGAGGYKRADKAN